MNVCLTDEELRGKLFKNGFVGPIEYPYTAIEIIDQMPEGTQIKKNLDGLWYVWFNLPSMQHVFRQDQCPHKAAALAFIAWKKGLE